LDFSVQDARLSSFSFQDENDRSPKFEEEYRAVVPVATPVNSALLRVRALDADKTVWTNFHHFAFSCWLFGVGAPDNAHEAIMNRNCIQ
jgi:hypothetical protein